MDLGRPQARSLDTRYFLLATLICAVTQVAALEAFPIYFFTDEAASTVLAAEFVQNGLRDASGTFFPTYFANNEKLSLSLSVYAQLIPVLIFGRSIVVARAGSALLAISGSVAAGLILRDAFGLRRAWLGVSLLTITPAWFLHSRTAFETSLSASLLSWSIYAYLRYRGGQPRALSLAVLLGGLAFYAYSAAQAGLLLTGLLLLLADAGYHRRNRRTLGLAVAVAALLALPYLRFQFQHPGDWIRRLELVDSYLVRPELSAAQKVGRLAEEYARALSPVYWYAPENQVDLIRHRMKGYGNILLPTLPLALLGLGLSLRRWRRPTHRAVLLAALCAPAGAALAGVLVTRALAFVIPAALITALGASTLLEWVARRWGDARTSSAAFAVLTLTAAWMLRDALVNGPTWYADYGLTGLQYGGREVFSEAAAYLEQYPDQEVWVFPTWLNGADMLRRFFLPEETRVQLLDLEGFLAGRTDGLERALLVLAQDDYLRVIESGKFAAQRIEKTLPLPDGRPGFRLTHLAYSPSADSLFEAERRAREAMVQERVVVRGRVADIRHTPFQTGHAADLFDGDPATRAFTASTNPMVIELTFGEPVRLSGLTIHSDLADLGLTVQGFASGLQPARYQAEFHDRGSDPALDITLDPATGPISRVVIAIQDLRASPTASIAIGELILREG